MYSSSSSSSQQQSSSNNNNNDSSHLLRYGSAPSSFYDSVMGPSHGQHQQHHQQQHQLFAESTQPKMNEPKNTLPLLRPYGMPPQDDDVGMNSVAPPSTTTSNLIRHSSSPAGFLNHLTSEIGFSLSKGMENYNSQGSTSMSSGGHKLSRLGSQLNFSKQDQHSLAQIAQECSFEGMSSHDHHQNNHEHSKRSTKSRSGLLGGFSLSPWDEGGGHNIVFSPSSSKRPKGLSDDILNGLSSIDAQALEIAAMDRLLIPQDSVPCKIRAKRGCATHPRSIAERERRTRISAKLKKLQELVPNMDKQTSYADMLNLAVQHIKGLQNQIQDGN